MSDQAGPPDAIPEPREGNRGGIETGPRDVLRERENPDLLTPPSTDSGTMPNLRFSFADAHMRLETGGWTREVTQRELPIATTLSGVNMGLNAGNPSGVREMHWHPNADEWQYYLEGEARMTVFASSGVARTFGYRAGDVGYVPVVMGHYVENTGESPLRVLEIFRGDHFADVSLNQ